MSSKKKEGGKGFLTDAGDPKPLTVSRTRPYGTELSESESEWDGHTACSVSTSTNGKPADVSSKGLKSKEPIVMVSNVKSHGTPSVSASGCITKSKMKTVNHDMNDVSENLVESGNVSEESPAQCLLNKELIGIRVMSSAIADSPDNTMLDHYRSHLEFTEKYLTERREHLVRLIEEYEMTANK